MQNCEQEEGERVRKSKKERERERERARERFVFLPTNGQTKKAFKLKGYLPFGSAKSPLMVNVYSNILCLNNL